MNNPVEIVFWLSLGLAAYTFAGYPLVLGLASFFRKNNASAATTTSSLSAVSVVLCVHNEESRITGRLTNLLATDYPAGRLEIIVVSDGSTDQTATLVTQFPDPRIRLLIHPARRGKASCLNKALAAATGEIIVFADSRQTFAPNAIPNLVRAFRDKRVGAVSGVLEIEEAASNAGKGIGFYWQLEKWVRRQESNLGNAIGCTGAIYAIRKELFREIPDDTILDDVVIPMNILTAGYRVIVEPTAIARDPQPLEPPTERIRKRRTLAGNYQMFFRHPEWILPWKNRAWWQLFSHKYLRLAAPWLLLVVFLTNTALADQELYRWLLAGQSSLYALATIGFLFPGLSFRLFSVPAGFLFLNQMAVAGLLFYLRGGAARGWETSSPPSAPSTRGGDD